MSATTSWLALLGVLALTGCAANEHRVRAEFATSTNLQLEEVLARQEPRCEGKGDFLPPGYLYQACRDFDEQGRPLYLTNPELDELCKETERCDLAKQSFRFRQRLALEELRRRRERAND